MVTALDGDDAPPPRAEADLGNLHAALSALTGAQRREAEAAQALAAHRANAPTVASGVAGGDSAAGEEAGDAAPEPALRDWSPIGRPARPVVARLRRAAATLVRRARAAAALRDRLVADEAALEQVAVFDDLSGETLELVSGYGQRERALIERLQLARTRRDDLLERVERHRAAFAEALRLTPAQLEALVLLERALEGRRDPRPYRLAAAVTLGLLGGIGLPPVLLALGWTLPGAGWLAAALGALLGVSMPFGDGTGAARARVEAAGLEGEDDELRQLLRQREAYDAQYDQVQSDAEALEEAEARLAEQEADGHAFLGAVSPVLQALPEGSDVDEAYRTWARLKPLVSGRRAELEALVVDLFDGGGRVDPEGFEAMPIARADGDLADLARLATFQGVVDPEVAPVTVGDLMVWLERVTEVTWATWEADAERHDAGRAELERREAGAEAARERHRVWGEALSAAADGARAERLRASSAFDAALDAVLQWSPESDPRRAEAAVAAAVAAAGDAAAARPTGELLIGEDDLEGAGSEPAVPATPAVSPSVFTATVARLGEWLAQARAAEARLERAERDLEAHLRSCDVDDLEGLRAQTPQLERTLESALALWRDVVRGHPDLPPAHLDPEAPPVDESGGFDPLRSTFAEVERVAEAAALREREAHDTLLAAQRMLAASEGAEAVNVAVLLEESAERLAEARAVRDEVASLALAYQELQAGVRAYSSNHRERLEARASEVLATVSASPGRRVRLDEGFGASVLERSGDTALPVQLSQGTRDQLALALRLAVLDLVAHDLPLPLILDDPFAHWDEQRLARAKSMLLALSRERQVLLLTHRNELAGWGGSVRVVAGRAG
jgi:chromosome segregation protein